MLLNCYLNRVFQIASQISVCKRTWYFSPILLPLGINISFKSANVFEAAWIALHFRLKVRAFMVCVCEDECVFEKIWHLEFLPKCCCFPWGICWYLNTRDRTGQAKVISGTFVESIPCWRRPCLQDLACQEANVQELWGTTGHDDLLGSWRKAKTEQISRDSDGLFSLVRCKWQPVQAQWPSAVLWATHYHDWHWLSVNGKGVRGLGDVLHTAIHLGELRVEWVIWRLSKGLLWRIKGSSCLRNRDILLTYTEKVPVILHRAC